MASSFEREGPGFHIAVTGGSGLIGAALIHHLMPDQHHRITRLVRRRAGPGELTWDPVGRRLDPTALEGLDAHAVGDFVHRKGRGAGEDVDEQAVVELFADRIETRQVTVAGAPGYRLDTLNDDSFQTVVVWRHAGRVVAVLVASSVREVTAREAHERTVGQALAAFDAG